MTETELTDRLREAIVLDGPDAWRTNGYLQDAQAAGLSLPDALKRANDISQEVSNNRILFQNIQARIARLAEPSRAHLIDQDINQIINAARSLNLSPEFVRNRWIPAELARHSPKPVPPVSEPAPVVIPPVAPVADPYEDLIEPVPAPAPPVVRVTEPAPVVEPPQPPPAPEPAYVPPAPLPEPPAPFVRTFTATPARVRQGQAVTIEWDVTNLLAVTIDDLGEGLSPKNRGWVKPKKTTDYTLFDVNNNPLSTVRVEVIPRDRSGIYGVLFALALLALIYWFIRNSNSGSRTRAEPSRQEQLADRSTTDETSALSQQETTPEPTASETETTPATDEDESIASDTKPADEPKVREPEPQRVDEPAPTPADARQGKYEEAFGDKPYDKVELGTDERGWRRARSRGRWGYIDQNDQWVIEPEYEAVTPFRGNTAGAFLNGQLITINRDGEQVRNP